jgi:hypothetical protein
MQLLIIQFPVSSLFICNIPSATCSQMPSVYILLLMSEMKFHTHTKLQAKLWLSSLDLLNHSCVKEQIILQLFSYGPFVLMSVVVRVVCRRRFALWYTFSFRTLFWTICQNFVTNYTQCFRYYASPVREKPNLKPHFLLRPSFSLCSMVLLTKENRSNT